MKFSTSLFYFYSYWAVVVVSGLSRSAHEQQISSSNPAHAKTYFSENLLIFKISVLVHKEKVEKGA